MFKASAHIVEPGVGEEQLCQGVVNQKRLIMSVGGSERGQNPVDRLVVASGLPRSVF